MRVPLLAPKMSCLRNSSHPQHFVVLLSETCGGACGQRGCVRWHVAGDGLVRVGGSLGTKCCLLRGISTHSCLGDTHQNVRRYLFLAQRSSLTHLSVISLLSLSVSFACLSHLFLYITLPLLRMCAFAVACLYGAPLSRVQAGLARHSGACEALPRSSRASTAHRRDRR